MRKALRNIKSARISPVAAWRAALAPRMPSPLDRPGLDDAPLREWVADAEDGDTFGFAEAHARELRGLVTPVEYAPGPGKSDDDIGDDRPEREPVANPISIELVRGANGPGNVGADIDEWTVLIDGVRCRPVKRPDDTFETSVDVYHLPLPFESELEFQRGPESVRPVALGVRIENEALVPAKVEVVVEQVVESEERVAEKDSVYAFGYNRLNGRTTDEETLKLETMELPVYTPLDHTAQCRAMAYPFRAPAQSALALMHVGEDASLTAGLMKQAQAAMLRTWKDMTFERKKWQNNIALRRSVNKHAARVNIAKTFRFVSAKLDRLKTLNEREAEITEQLTESKKRLDKKSSKNLDKIVPGYAELSAPQKETRKKKLSDEDQKKIDDEIEEKNTKMTQLEADTEKKLTKLNNRIDRERVKQNVLKHRNVYVSNEAIVRRFPTPLRVSSTIEALKADDHCTILGGGELSAIQDLSKQFDHLLQAVASSKAKLKNFGAGSTVSRAQLVQEMHRFLIQLNQMKAARLLESMLRARPTFQTYKDMEPKTDGKGFDKAAYAKVFKPETAGIHLLMHRLGRQELEQTSVRTRLRVRFTDSGKTKPDDQEWVFEASRKYGYLAHASYRDEYTEMERLKGKIANFKEALQEPGVREDVNGLLTKTWQSLLGVVEATPDAVQEFFKSAVDYAFLDDRGKMIELMGTLQRQRDYVSIGGEAGLAALRLSQFGKESGFDALGLAGIESLMAAVGQTQEVQSKIKKNNEKAKSVAKYNWWFSDDPMNVLYGLLATPGVTQLLTSWIKSDPAKEDEVSTKIFTVKNVDLGFKTMNATLLEIETCARQSLPYEHAESASGRRSYDLVYNAALATAENDTEADGAKLYLQKLRRAEYERVAVERLHRDFYCRMPNIVSAKPPKALSFRNPELMVVKALDLEELLAIKPQPTWVKFLSAVPLLFTIPSFIKEYREGTGVNDSAPTYWDSFTGTLSNLAAKSGFLQGVSTASFALANVGNLKALASAVGMTASSSALLAGSILLRGIGSVFDYFTTEQGTAEVGESEDELRKVELSSRDANNLLRLSVDAANVVQRVHQRIAYDHHKKGDKFKKCMEKARGNPIQSAVQNGSYTSKKLHKSLEEAGGSFLVNADGARFRFFERFRVRHTDEELLRSVLYQPSANLAWARMPDGLALRFVPPLELVENIREGEDLRRVAMNAAIARVTDTALAPRPQSGADLAQLSARRIHTELQIAIRDDWLFPKTKSGRSQTRRNYVTRSAPQTAAMLAEEARKLLLAAFGTEVPTLVDASDPFFDCFAGGGAVRLAIRHLPVVEDTLNEIANEALLNKNWLGAATKAWTTERKHLLRALCDAWKTIATSTSSMFVSHLDLSTASREALSSFGRIAALAPKDDNAARLAAASAAAALHSVIGRDASEARREQGLRALATADGELGGFAYQSKLRMPTDAPRTPGGDKTAFAARRLDYDAMRKAPLGDGIEALIEALGPADLLGVHHETEHYYVACGENLDFQPSPLLYSGVVAQPVWLERVVDACVRLDASLSEEGLLGIADLEAGHAVVRRRPRTAPGLARHPLVVTRSGQGEGEVIGLQLLSMQGDAVPFRRDDDAEGPFSLLQAMAVLCNTATPDDEFVASAASEVANNRVARARVFAFNVDRCAAGLALAASAPRTDVEVAEELLVTQAAVGLALAQSTSDQVRLRVADATRARAQLDRLRARCASALERECKATTLAELAVALVDLEDASGL